MSQFTPESFVNSLVSLVGCRYIHQGRNPELGVDCAGAVVVAATRAGWLARNPSLTLSSDYEMFPRTDDLMRAALSDEANRVDYDDFEIHDDGSGVRFGDLLTMGFDQSLMVNDESHALHIGILVPPPLHVTHRDFYLCHAVRGKGVVCHIWSNEWKQRVQEVYRFKDFV